MTQQAQARPCKRCKTIKPLTSFYPNPKGAGFRQPCKTCWSEIRRERYRTTDEADRGRARNLARYGLSPDQYDEMVAEQGGVCAVCGQPQRTRNTDRLSVDHDHATGRVRQLLCNPCNLAIGYIETHDLPLDGLAAYLNRHRRDGAVA